MGGLFTGHVAVGSDPTAWVMLLDDFFSSQETAANFEGGLGWNVKSIGAPVAFTVTTRASTWPNIGVIRMNAGTTVSTGITMSCSPTTSDPGTLGLVQQMAGWEMIAIFKINQTASIRFKIGLANQFTAVNPTDGVWLRFDTNVPDTNFIFEWRQASTSNTVDSGVAAETANFHKARIRGYSVGGTTSKIGFQLDSQTENVADYTFGSTAMAPVIILQNAAATASKTCDIDYFGWVLTNAKAP
jgi:hypothetical protein